MSRESYIKLSRSSQDTTIYFPHLATHSQTSIPMNPLSMSLNPITKSRMKKVALVLLIAIISTIGLLIFFMYPRNVEYIIDDLKIIDTSLTSTGFKANVQVNNTITNENYFDVNVYDYSIIVTHPLYTSNLVDSRENQMYLEKNRENKNQVFFDMEYNTQLDPNQMYLNNVIANCSQETGNLYFDTKTFGWGEYIWWKRQFSFTSDIYIDCKEYTQLLRLLDFLRDFL